MEEYLQEELQSLMDEPLHPDLVPYLQESPLGISLKHPLVFQLIPLNGMANRQYAFKTKEIERAIREQNWSTFIWLHERPYRSHALAEVAPRVSEEEYWKLFRDVWVDTENLYQWNPPVEDLIVAHPNPRLMMDEEETSKLSEQGREIRIYRGWNKQGTVQGYSWTMEPAIAEWFARRFTADKAAVASGVVDTSEVYALVLQRGEVEIIVEPTLVSEVTIRNLESNE